ncbi:MAG: SPOR domain-containing protein [Sphingomonas sp.]|uniref:SPOR domain-containing protein n=1 Tax=Sphingomonas sp. TaxID=28214 RepID=UPI0022764668|nr:SPOR domain-containing protein [Sphingomonas sp.]MCX8477048.1 SPOR domain-containing protein [Sphingomonas sp.]
MKSNASAIAALLLLAGFGGERALAYAASGSGGQTAPGASYPVPGTAPARAQPQAAPRIDYATEADPTSGMQGPRGSSQHTPGEQRYDEIGYAAINEIGAGVTAVHAGLPADTLVEVTSLENGRTIVALVTATDPNAAKPITLSVGAARELGHAESGQLPVRVRRVAAAPGDMLALRSGRPAPARPDTPPVLLNALRKHLGTPATVAFAAAVAAERPAPAPVRATPAARPPRPTPPPRAVRPATGAGFYVQIAALSNARNAQALAQRMGGFVKQGGGLHRVQLGPFATRREAEAARGGAARAGYGDARVLAVN